MICGVWTGWNEMKPSKSSGVDRFLCSSESMTHADSLESIEICQSSKATKHHSKNEHGREFSEAIHPH